MQIDIGTFTAVAVPTVTVIVWLVRLEGRINVNDESIKTVKDDVRYIRERIDRALNGHE